MKFYRIEVSIILYLFSTLAAVSQTDNTVAPQDSQIVDYPASFFVRYQPSTALEMVNQIPGFILNNGDSERGFGGAVGNILINDRRPSAKQDPPSQILNRIPANQVERVELIRGQVRNINLQGHSIVANVILRLDAPAAARWEASMRYNFSIYPPTFDVGMSVSDRWGEIEYNTGIRGRSGTSGEAGIDRRFNDSGTLMETTLDGFKNRAYNSGGNLNASTWFGETFIQLNTELFVEKRNSYLSTHIFPEVSGNESGRETIDGDFLLTRFELGTDAERLLNQDLLGKAILLFSYRDSDTLDDKLVFNATDNVVLQTLADTETVTTELIARLELDWTRWNDHTIQADFELAYNVLDNTLLQTEDIGDGPVEAIIQGANTQVKEVRGDFMVQDTWALGNVEVDLGLGGEVSRISQSGDAEEERDFFFLKPLALITYSPGQGSQTRLRVLREVAQLNFNDFVSTSVFEDDDLALGNPNLRPDTTWISELSHERRFGEIGVVSLTGFYHWISDVQDLLPLTDEFEVPGNIGNGRRWGVEMESAMPLTWLGLPGSRLDMQLRWQDSLVTDPVTGQKRVLSSSGGFPKPLPFRAELEFIYIVKFRQDFQEARVAWGIEARERTERPRFKVNELEIFDEGLEINTFVETTRFGDLKVRIEGQDILDFNQSRDRTIYQELRGRSPVARTILRDRNDGARVFISVSGNF